MCLEESIMDYLKLSLRINLVKCHSKQLERTVTGTAPWPISLSSFIIFFEKNLEVLIIQKEVQYRDKLFL